MAFWHRITRKWAIPVWAGATGSFLMTAAVSTYIQWRPLFRDPDSFYHMKMAVLLLRDGIVWNFPWLPFTVLSDHFADHHFLYHVLLTPFIAAFGPENGMLIATATLCGAAMAAFYVVLREYQVRFPSFFVFLLITSQGFAFRFNLAKATGASLLTIMLALLAIRRRNYLALFLLAWAYVLLYGGWPIIAGIVGIALLSRIVADRLVERHPIHSWAHLWFWRRLFRGSQQARQDFFLLPEIRAAVATVAGIVCGIVINPYFPRNLQFYWQQIYQIALVGYRGRLNVGVEWFPATRGEMIGYAGGPIIFLLAVVGLVIIAAAWGDIIFKKREHGADEFSALFASAVLTLVFMCLTLRSKRNVEYFLPFLVLFEALFAKIVFSGINFRRLYGNIIVHAGQTILVSVVAAFTVVFLALNGVRDVSVIRGSYGDGISWNRYAGVSSWLREHVPAGSVIYHSEWDDFPVLFWRDDRYRYISGLDPAFLFLKSPSLYDAYYDVSTGRTGLGASNIIMNTFGAKYVVIKKGYMGMQRAVAKYGGATLEYQDDDGWIYSLQ